MVLTWKMGTDKRSSLNCPIRICIEASRTCNDRNKNYVWVNGFFVVSIPPRKKQLYYMNYNYEKNQFAGKLANSNASTYKVMRVPPNVHNYRGLALLDNLQNILPCLSPK